MRQVICTDVAVSSVESLIFFEDVATFVIEDKVVGSEHFDDACSWWVDMVINFVLGGLCIFTDARSDETGEGQHIKE